MDSVSLPSQLYRKDSHVRDIPIVHRVEQVVACAPVTHWAQVRFLVGASFLGEVFRGFP